MQLSGQIPSPLPPFFNKPRYILKGFYQKCGHLFSQPQGTFLCVTSDVPSLREGEVGGTRQGVLHGGQAPPGPRGHGDADLTHMLNDERWLLLSLRGVSVGRAVGSGTLTQAEVGQGSPWADAASHGQGKRRRGEMAGTPPLPWGQPRGHHLGAVRRREGSGEQSGRTRPAALAWPCRRCCSARPSAAVSPSAASPGGDGPWAPWLLHGPGSLCRASEALCQRGWRPFGVSWGRFPHRETFITWLYHRASKACCPQAMVLEERHHMAFLLLVKPMETPRP